MTTGQQGRWLHFFRHPGAIRLSWPTRITLMRILLIVPFVACMLNINDVSLDEPTRRLLRYIAVTIFVVMAVSDALDGYLARHLKQITRFGTFLDPLADKLLMTSACLLLVSDRGHVSGFRLPETVVVLIIGKDVLTMLGFLVVYLITSHIHIVPVAAGKLATAIQLVMVSLILIAPELSAVVPGYQVFLRIVWWSAGAAAVLATLVYIRNGSRYIEAFERTQASEKDA